MGGGDLNASLVVHRTVLTVLEASGLFEKYPCRRRANVVSAPIVRAQDHRRDHEHYAARRGCFGW